MQSRDSETLVQSAQEWAEPFRRTTKVPGPVLSRGIPGPGWLDDDTPCACSRVRIFYGANQLDAQIFAIEKLLSSPLHVNVVRTFDPTDKSTKGQ